MSSLTYADVDCTDATTNGRVHQRLLDVLMPFFYNFDILLSILWGIIVGSGFVHLNPALLLFKMRVAAPFITTSQIRAIFSCFSSETTNFGKYT